MSKDKERKKKLGQKEYELKNVNDLYKFLSNYETNKTKLNEQILLLQDEIRNARGNKKLVSELNVRLSEAITARTELQASLQANNIADNQVDINNKIVELEDRRVTLNQDIVELKTKELGLISNIGGGLQIANSIITNTVSVVEKTLDYWLKIDKASTDYQRTIGGTNTSLHEMRKTTLDIVNNYKLAQNIGLSSLDMIKTQQAFVESVGRNISLSERQMINLGSMSKLVGDSNTTILANSLELLGMTANEGDELINNLFNESTQRGLTFSKTSKEFIDNLKVAQSYTFVDGVKGMERMAMESVKLRLNMQQVLGFADKISNVEDAIKMSANLQVLGGPFTTFANNPLDLLYKATNDPETLQKDISKMFSSLGNFNSDTGEVNFGVVEQRQIRQAANLMGINYNDAIALGSTGYKQGLVENQIGNNFDNNKTFKDFFINTSTWDKEKREWVINDNGKTITQSELLNDEKLLDKLINKQTPNTKDTTDINTILRSTSDKFEGLRQQAKETQAGIIEAIGINGQSIGVIAGEIANKIGNSNMWLSIIAGLSLANSTFTDVKNITQSVTRGLGGKATNGKIKPSIKGFGAGGLMGVTGLLGDSVNNYMVNNNIIEEGGQASNTISDISSMLSMAGTGAMIGSIFGPMGTAIGGILGGVGGLVSNYFSDKQSTNIKASSGGLLVGPSHNEGGIKGNGSFSNIEVEGNEFIIKKEVTEKNLPFLQKLNNSDGEIVKTTQPLGEIMTVSTNTNSSSSSEYINNDLTRIDISPLDINISGSIKLDSNGRSVNLDKEIINNPIFISKLTDMITKQININTNSTFNRNKFNRGIV